MISPILMATGVNFASGFLKGMSGRNSAAAEAELYAKEAEIYRRNARLTRLNGAKNEDVMRSQNRAYLAQAFAAAGEAGMAESPTMMNELASSFSVLEQNVLNARYRTESEAENYIYQSRLAVENSRQMKEKSKNIFRNALISGIGSGFRVYGNGTSGMGAKMVSGF